ncbi:Glutamine-dependent NAD(+) synthetase [Manis javanica]|nr:Glutamine-dependent NAD(+) synthetase [Manis javanica]
MVHVKVLVFGDSPHDTKLIERIILRNGSEPWQCTCDQVNKVHQKGKDIEVQIIQLKKFGGPVFLGQALCLNLECPECEQGEAWQLHPPLFLLEVPSHKPSGESSSPLIKPQPLQFLVPTAAASDLRSSLFLPLFQEENPWSFA